MALFVLAAAFTPGGSAAAPSDSAAFRVGRRDALFAAAATGAVAWAAVRDRHASGVAQHNDTRFALDLAATAKRLGDPVTMGGALLATGALARLTGHDRVGAAAERMLVAALAAGAVTVTLKTTLGRERPDESPADAMRFRPFSRHDAFPSGHASTAFAIAAALDAETESRWVPCIAYPLAAVTAWSRVRDGRHWPSDVVGAAALAGWTAHHVDRWAQQRMPRGFGYRARPVRGGIEARVGLEF